MAEQLAFPTVWLLLVGAGLLLNYVRVRQRRKRVIRRLTILGASDIRARYRFFDLDISAFSFNVSYQDAAGSHHNTICKVRGGWLLEQSLHWEQAPKRSFETASSSA